ncbi:hypothetical protein I8752_29915 [Nostocaceae cyanobacterium CENA369]|uniref:Uncharacterized protein n=1 Tax=Dendronalium phyllosphericum CENA369 TaxID=1725256 RepID=A0A8J7LHA7_9NOST|nr:hypothetical protein [Dendronalium phyllosphericum CENA369]
MRVQLVRVGKFIYGLDTGIHLQRIARAFTLGIAALSLASLRLVERGMTGVMQELALLLFMGANIAIGSIALGTVRILLRGKLLS